MQLIKCVFKTKYSKNKSIKNMIERLKITPKVTGCGRQRSEVQTLLLQCCALRKFQVTDVQNTRDQITRSRRKKRAWSNCVRYFLFSLWVLATHMRPMRNYNLEIRIAGFSCRPQLSIQDLSIKLFLIPGTRNSYSVGPSFDVAMPKWKKRRMHTI